MLAIWDVLTFGLMVCNPKLFIQQLQHYIMSPLLIGINAKPRIQPALPLFLILTLTLVLIETFAVMQLCYYTEAALLLLIFGLMVQQIQLFCALPDRKSVV